MEATVQLLDKGGHDLVTTNAVAKTAGVSIGTLYQYFSSKEAILDALSSREVAALEARIVAVMQGAHAASPRERIAAVVHAVSAGYGRRRRAHRLMMEYSLARSSQRLAPLLERSTTLMMSSTRHGPNNVALPLSHADAFVLIHALVGVMRAMIGAHDNAPPREQIEEAVTRLLIRFVGLDEQQ